MKNFGSVNFKGDLFATALTFGAQAIIKLGSNLVLTRILRPEAYGIITLLMSILFVIEMLGDLGLNLFVIRDISGELPRYLNTAWTIRLCRGVLNTAIVFIAAPYISKLYGTVDITAALRVLSLWFVISGLETMSFPIAIRRKRARIIVYSELVSVLISTVVSIAYCYYSRDYWGLVIGSLLSRFMLSAMSYGFYSELRPKFHIDWQAAREVLRFTKYSMPSSILTLALSQFDKVIFVRLFDLRLLGLYGLAGNMAGPVEQLISKISQTVLYPRCAHDYREERSNFSLRYYKDNIRVILSMLVLPPIIGGASHLIVWLLYPSRYAEAEAILRAFMVRAAVLAMSSSAEDLLIAAGESQVILVGNLLRAVWIVLGSLGGYYVFGFPGFVYGMSTSGVACLVYYLGLQSRRGYLIAKYEYYRLAFLVVIAVCSYVGSSVVVETWLHFH